MNDWERTLGTVERGRKAIAGWSRELFGNAHQIAVEGDRWFVSLVEGLDRSAERAQAGLGRWVRSLPGLRTRESPRQRIQRLIFVEAKKQGFDTESAELELFSERIAVLVELVLTGAIKIDDIAFEPQVSETGPESGPPPPAL